MGGSGATGSAIVHLVGYPGLGKYTVATALRRLAEGRRSTFVVVDNHLTSNVIFAVLPVDGIRPLPPTVWDRVGEVRDAVLRTIEELSPPSWSFVFTNVLNEDVPDDLAVVERLVALAATRGSRYVPVVLTCDTEELLRRVPRPDRADRHKWIDPDGVRAFVAAREVLDITHPHRLTIDVTSTSPGEAAAQILDHVVRLA